MELNQKDIRGGILWLLCAGGIAILFSATLFWVDNSIMEGATDRDKAHAAEMAELREAQASVPGRVTDSRQTLPLTLEAEQAPSAKSKGH